MSITMKDVFITWNNSLTSANTMKKYNLSVKLYFQMVLGKEPYDISESDLKNLSYGDTVNKFVALLRNKGVKDSTIKSHLI